MLDGRATPQEVPIAYDLLALDDGKHQILWLRLEVDKLIKRRKLSLPRGDAKDLGGRLHTILVKTRICTTIRRILVLRLQNWLEARISLVEFANLLRLEMLEMDLFSTAPMHLDDIIRP